MNTQLDHIAIQVDSLDRVSERLESIGLQLGKPEEFPDEGTRELYVGDDDQSSRLLLLEPIGEGPYQQSMAKRGPGLHHIAIDVSDVEAFVSSLAGTGWLLHVRSLNSMRELGTAWLARPNVPFVVEVFCSGRLATGSGAGPERIESATSPSSRRTSGGEFVSSVEIPIPEDLNRIVESLDQVAIQVSQDTQTWLTFKDQRISCQELCS